MGEKNIRSEQTEKQDKRPKTVLGEEHFARGERGRGKL